MSTQITVQRQFSSGTAMTNGTTTVNLASSSNGGHFYSDQSGSNEISSRTISAGSSTATFYYLDYAAGNPILTASAIGFTSATTTFTITGNSEPRYSTTNSPTQVMAGSPASFTVTVTMRSTLQVDISYVTITIPSGFTGITITSVTTNNSGTWTGSLAGNVITLTSTGVGDDLEDGTHDAVKVVFTATPQTAGTYTFATTIYGHPAPDPTENHNLGPGSNSGPDPSVTVYVPDHFAFNTIGTQTAGTAFNITITAQDVNNNTVTIYTSSNSLTVSTGTISPISTTAFTAGVWTGPVTVTKSGTGITIGTTGATKSGTSNGFTVNPGALASFTITGYPTSVAAGQSFGSNSVTVTAYDAYGNVKTDYAGSVYFTSTDSQATLPYTASSKYTFVGGDNGNHTFPGTGFTLKTVGSRTITVTDGTVSKSSSSIAVSPGALTSFTIAGYPSSVAVGQSFSGTVTAYDAYGNVKTDYTGTVHFTSTDGQAVLPGDYPFLAGDNGVKTFTNGFTLKTVGPQTVTVTDGSISATSNTITVSTVTLALDVSNSNSGYSSSATVSLTTTKTNDLLYVSVSISHDQSVSGVTSSPSLTWTRRASVTYSSSSEILETWYAIMPSSGSVAITVSVSGGSTHWAVVALAVSGANTGSPFESTPPSSASGSSGTSATVTLATSNAGDFIIGALGLNNDPGLTTGTGFNLVKTATSSGYRETSVEYKIATTQPNSAGYSWSGSNNWAIIGDAIKPAS